MQARKLIDQHDVAELAQLANDVANAALRFVSLCAPSRGAVHNIAAIRSALDALPVDESSSSSSSSSSSACFTCEVACPAANAGVTS